MPLLSEGAGGLLAFFFAPQVQQKQPNQPGAKEDMADAGDAEEGPLTEGRIATPYHIMNTPEKQLGYCKEQTCIS